MVCTHLNGPLASLEYAKPLQEPGELELLIDFFLKRNVRSYLEIGGRYGGSFERIMMALPPGSKGVVIDFPGGNFGDANSAPILLAAIDRIRSSGRNADVIFGPSQAWEVSQRAYEFGPYDAVMIDGDHSYRAVQADYRLYKSMAPIVAIHDIKAPPEIKSRTGKTVDVPQFWADIKGKHELAIEGSIMGFGIVEQHQ